MPHLHTGPNQHDFTASAYIVRLDTPEPTIMLHMHKKLGKYLQFGGHVELDETPWQAIVHELAEESGYTLDELELLQPPIRMHSLSDADLHPHPINIQTHRFADQDHFHIDISFAFVASGPAKAAIAAGESTDVRLLTVAELEALDATTIPDNARETSLFVLEQCLPQWERVATPTNTRQL